MFRRSWFQISLANWMKLSAVGGLLMALPAGWIHWHHARLFEHQRVDFYVEVVNSAYYGFPHRDYAIYVSESTLKSGRLRPRDLNTELEVLRQLGASDRAVQLIKRILLGKSKHEYPIAALEIIANSTEQNRQFLLELTKDPTLSVQHRLKIIDVLDQCAACELSMRRQIVDLVSDWLSPSESSLDVRRAALQSLPKLRSTSITKKQLWRTFLHYSLLPNDPLTDDAYSHWMELRAELTDNERRELVGECQNLLGNDLSWHAETRLMETLVYINPKTVLAPAILRFNRFVKSVDPDPLHSRKDAFYRDLSYQLLTRLRTQILEDQGSVRSEMASLVTLCPPKASESGNRDSVDPALLKWIAKIGTGSVDRFRARSFGAYSLWCQNHTELSEQEKRILSQECQKLLLKRLSWYSEARVLEVLIAVDPLASLKIVPPRFERFAQFRDTQQRGNDDYCNVAYRLLAAVRDEPLEDRREVHAVFRTLVTSYYLPEVLRKLQKHDCLDRSLWLCLLDNLEVPSRLPFTERLGFDESLIPSIVQQLPHRSASRLAYDESHPTARAYAVRHIELRQGVLRMIDQGEAIAKSLDGDRLGYYERQMVSALIQTAEDLRRSRFIDDDEVPEALNRIAKLIRLAGQIRLVPLNSSNGRSSIPEWSLTIKEIQAMHQQAAEITRVLQLNPEYSR